MYWIWKQWDNSCNIFIFNVLIRGDSSGRQWWRVCLWRGNACGLKFLPWLMWLMWLIYSLTVALSTDLNCAYYWQIEPQRSTEVRVIGEKEVWNLELWWDANICLVDCLERISYQATCWKQVKLEVGFLCWEQRTHLDLLCC